MPRRTVDPPNTTDRDIARIVGALHRQILRGAFEFGLRCEVTAEVCIRFGPVAIYCRHARETRGEDLKSAAKASKIPQYVLRRIEDGDVFDLELPKVARYIEHLELEDWFESWIGANARMLAFFSVPPAARETLRPGDLDELVAELGIGAAPSVGSKPPIRIANGSGPRRPRQN